MPPRAAMVPSRGPLRGSRPETIKTRRSDPVKGFHTAIPPARRGRRHPSPPHVPFARLTRGLPMIDHLLPPVRFTRRDFLRTTGAAAGLVLMGTMPARRGDASVRFAAYPFTL